MVLAGCAQQPAQDGDEAPPVEEAVPVAVWAEPEPPPAMEDRLPVMQDQPLPSPFPAVLPAPGSGQAGVSPEATSGVGPAPVPDTWARIRKGLSLPDRTHPRVEREIRWYAKNQDYLRRTADRARLYLPYIVRQVEQRGMPLELALLPVVESAFQPFAYSPMGAAGLWQFIPATGRLYGLKQGWWYDARRDIVASTRAALRYLSKLSQDFDGDWLLAVAAYNWGEGNVMRAVARNRARGKPADVWSLRLPRETRVHVSRLLAVAAIVAEPDRHGVVLAPIPDQVHFRQVALDGQLDLGVAASLAGITLDEIHELNPGFNQWATDPDGPHRLLLPRSAVERFRAGLAELPAEERVQWIRHRIAPGDTLGAIARRYRTSVAVLKDRNGLASDRIRAGRDLMIPVSVRAIDAPRLSAAMRARLDRAAARSSVKSIYTVRGGDSLWRIARRHRVGMKQLAAWNGLSMKAVLQPGQRLTIHRRGAIPSRIALPRPAAESAGASPAPAVHVVRRGDTLSGIAARHGTTVRALTKLNDVGRNTILLPGRKLRVAPAGPSRAPASSPAGGGKAQYRVERGDSLWEISRRFGVTIASLREWNRLPEGQPLMPGRSLRVAPRALAPAGREKVQYRVKRGDSLWEISRQFGVTVASLREWNRLPEGQPLMPGQKLDVHVERAPAI